MSQIFRSRGRTNTPLLPKVWRGGAVGREPLPAAVAAAGEGAAEVPAFAPLYAVYAPVKREPATATLIPYFAWANRGENEMTVWLRG